MMAYTRSRFAEVTGELTCQRYIELSDLIRGRNKVEERLLNARLKCYEREKKIRLNILRKEQYQLERIRTSLLVKPSKIRIEKQVSSLPKWLTNRSKSEKIIFPLISPELDNTNWLLNSNSTSILSSNTNNNIFTILDSIRPHTTR